MHEIVYRLLPDQIGRLRSLALGFLGLTVVLDVASALTGGPWWIVSVFSGIFTVWFGVSWWGQRRAFTRVDDWGIRARIFLGPEREAAWPEIEDIVLHRTDRNEQVHVELRSGSGFSLAAPVHSTLLPNRTFMRAFEAIHEAWLSTR